RLVTLVGPGGIGKTRLAIAAASSFRERGRLPAGFISLASIRDPELVPDAIATAIGVPVGLGGAEPALLAALADPEALLVVDNLEQVIRAGPFLARLLAALPRLRLLATSREPLRIAAEREVPVPPLPIEPDPNRASADGAPAEPSPAVQLFIDRAEAINPGVTAQTDQDLLTEI